MVKILLVEDNEDNRDMLTRRLERRGYQLVIAVDGASAVEMARAEAPDLILMDMGLPVLDGWQATTLIRQMPETQSIPIIGLSADAMEGDRERGLAVGCDDYDTKPIDINRLLDKINVILEKGAHHEAE
jgi:two-component system cell cycle response regulator DivK